MPAVVRFDPVGDVIALRDAMSRPFTGTVDDGVSSGSISTAGAA